MSEKYTQSFNLVIRPTGKFGGLNARITKNPTRLATDERVLKLTISLPKALWVTPQLSASIDVPNDKVSTPVINSEVLDNIKQVLEQQTGMTITLNLIDQK